MEALAALTFKRDHRPIVRVVAAFEPSTLGHEPPPQNMSLRKIILKNIGRGPGMPVVVYRPSDETLLRDVEAIEPLGAADDEVNRPGRMVMTLQDDMKMDQTYELYYQDIVGRWHLTRFRPVPYKIQCSFVGEVPERKVPGAVSLLATVAKP